MLLENEAKKIKDKVFAAISRANELTKTGSEKLTFWIKRFVENCPTLEITNEMFPIATIDEDLKDVDVFEAKVCVFLDKFLESLIKRGVDQAAFQMWDPAPHDHIFTSMFGCQSLCPFCKSLCDQTIANHAGSHSTKIHRPQCCIGYREMTTGVLHTSICTADVASERQFQNSNTSFQLHSYKDYRSVNDYYKSWSVPPDPSFEASTYWQWFVATFSKELTEHYKATKPKIHSTWKKRTLKEVKRQLRQEYSI